MSFVLTRLNEPSDVVDVHFVPLVDSTSHYLVVARRQSIDIYWIEPDQTLKLRRSISVLDSIIGLKPFEPLELPGRWLILATESNKIMLVAFRGSIQKDIVVEEYDLKGFGHYLSIEPGSLCAENGRFFSVYTTQGSVCIFMMVRGKNLKNFEKALNPRTKAKQLLFDPPRVMSMTNAQGRTPMVIESIISHYEDTIESTLSVLFRDDLYNYYTSYFALNEEQLEHNYRIKCPEEMSSVIVPLQRNIGNILFGKSGMYIRIYPDAVNGLQCGTNLKSGKDGHTIETVEKDNTIQLVKKTIPNHTWNITAAQNIEPELPGQSVETIFTSSDGHLYISEVVTDITMGNDGYPDQLIIKSWSVRRFPSKLPPAQSFVQISQDTFIVFSNTSGHTTFTIDPNAMALKVLHREPCTPPLLDFNITGSAVPKVQMLGGSSMTDGLIRTEFKGYNTEVTVLGKVKTKEGVTGIWKFGDMYVINCLDDVQLFEFDGIKLQEVNDFHDLRGVDGSILDMFMLFGKLICVTENGIYQDGQMIQEGPIEVASITQSSNVAIVSRGTLEFKNEKYKLTDECSCIHALEASRKTYIMVGSWSGETRLYLDGRTRLLHKSDLAVNSVLIKKIGSTLLYIIGGADGSLLVVNHNDVKVELSIGSAPVTISDLGENSILVSNRENALKLMLDDDGKIIEKGYMNIDIPDVQKLDPVSGQLVTFNNGSLALVEISPLLNTLQNEMRIPKLPRKIVKFKNFLNLSLVITVTEKYNETVGRQMMVSQLEVLDNNTFKTKSIHRLLEGVELTDVVSTTYRRDIIDTYEEEHINMGLENVLSQCFVVSCIYHMQDDTGPPLMLFSVDEHGIIQYQCSAEASSASFYALTNHTNRLVIGAGTHICAYQIEYSVADSKFSLKRASDAFESRYYSSSIKSVGPDVVVGDVIKSPKRLRLRMKDTVDENGLLFKWQEDSNDMDHVSFLTAMESYENLIITADSLKNIQVSLMSADFVSSICQFNIGDQINVIKVIERHRQRGLTGEEISNLFVEGLDLSRAADIVPLFLFGSAGGALYLMSLVTKGDVVRLLEDGQEVIVGGKLKTLAKDKDGESVIDKYLSMRNWKGVRRNIKPMTNFIDGELIQKYDDDVAKDLITDNCVLL